MVCIDKIRHIENQLLYWGWPLCTRTTYRIIEHFEKFPRIVRAIQKYTGIFRNGFDVPLAEAIFSNKIALLEMGCGYICLMDEMNRVYSWGDNYAVGKRNHNFIGIAWHER